MRNLPLAPLVLVATWVSLACFVAACGDDKEVSKTAEGEGEGERRSAVSSGAGLAEQAAKDSLLGDLKASPTGGPDASSDGPDPVIPDLGGPKGPMMAGWEGLKPGMKPADLKKMRPKARGSELTPLVYTEALAQPWLAASYRFSRLEATIASVAWSADPRSRGPAVFRGMSKQGLHRWRQRPKFTEDKEHKRARFGTSNGPIVLSMSKATGFIRMEWKPPAVDKPDPLEDALAQAMGKGAGSPQPRPSVASTPRPAQGIPTRPDGAPPVSRP